MPKSKRSVKIVPVTSIDASSDKSETRALIQEQHVDGLNITEIHQFIKRSGGRSKLANLTIQEVYMEYISDGDAADNESYVERMKRFDHKSVDTPRLHVICSWNDKFLEVMDIMLMHCETLEIDCIWLDLFCIGRPSLTNANVIARVTEVCNQVLLIIPHWNNALFLKDSWSLYQIHYAFSSNTDCCLGFSAKDFQTMKQLVDSKQWTALLAPYQMCNILDNVSAHYEDVVELLHTTLSKSTTLYSVNLTILNKLKQMLTNFITVHVTHQSTQVPTMKSYWLSTMHATQYNIEHNSKLLIQTIKCNLKAKLEQLHPIQLHSALKNIITEHSELTEKITLSKLYESIRHYSMALQVYVDMYQHFVYITKEYYGEDWMIQVMEYYGHIAKLFVALEQPMHAIHCYELIVQCHHTASSSLSHPIVQNSILTLAQVYYQISHCYQHVDNHSKQEEYLLCYYDECLKHKHKGQIDKSLIESMKIIYLFYTRQQQHQMDKALQWKQRLVHLLQEYIQWLAQHTTECPISLLYLIQQYVDIQYYTIAQELCERVITICTKELGPLHHTTLTAHLQLSQILIHTRQYEFALQIELIYSNLLIEYGNMNPITIEYIIQLGKIYNLCGNYENAKSYLMEGYEIVYMKYGKTHRKTLEIMIELGKYRMEIRHYKAAEYYLMEALQYSMILYGIEDDMTLNCMMHVAMVNHMMHQYIHTQHILEQVVTIRMKLQQDKELIETRRQLCILYMTMQQYAPAERLLLQCKQQCHMYHQEDELLNARINSLLGTCYFKQTKYELAYPIFCQTLILTQKYFGGKHVDTLSCMYNVAQLLMIQGKFAESEQMLMECLHGRMEILDPHHRSIQATQQSLQELQRMRKPINIILNAIVSKLTQWIQPSNRMIIPTTNMEMQSIKLR